MTDKIDGLLEYEKEDMAKVVYVKQLIHAMIQSI